MTAKMPMDSLEFKQLVADFGRDLKAIGDRLYDASEGELPEPEVDDAVAAARAKIIAYEELLADPRLDDIKRSQLASTFAGEVDWLRERLAAT